MTTTTASTAVPAIDGSRPVAGGLGLCSALLVLWFVASMTGVVAPHAAVAPLVGLLAQLLLLCLVLIHCALFNGWGRALTFFAVTVVVAFLFEACSIATGFPDGFFTHNMPFPKILGVPLIVPPAYFTGAWPAWALAKLVGQASPLRTGRGSRFTIPVVAAFISTGVDLPIDPIESTVNNLWTWHHPSGYLGVPLTNFLGLLLTIWTIFQIFAFIERTPWRPVVARRAYWLLPCLLWVGMAIPYPIRFAMAPAGSVTRGGLTVPIADVYEAGVVASLFGIVFVTCIALARLWGYGDEMSPMTAHQHASGRS